MFISGDNIIYNNKQANTLSLLLQAGTLALGM